MARDWTIGPRARGALRYLAALGMVAVSTAVAEVIYRVFHTDRLSMVFLAGVLVAAVTLGPGPAYFAEVTGDLQRFAPVWPTPPTRRPGSGPA